MRVYCTSKNAGPERSGPDSVLYLGTSVKEAEAAVGEFTRYQNSLPAQDRIRYYSALPREIDWEMIQFFMADGWWYSIVMFELEEET